jgi:Second Messenger Oligonucleotide or Dinucleotide Synthetase domain
VTETAERLVLSEYFKQFRSNIEPPEGRRKLAAEIPAKVREFLVAHAEFPTVDPHSYLVGSYPRYTATGVIKDVDFLVLVPHDDETVDPTTVLKNLQSALKGLAEHLGYESVDPPELRAQRRSVHIYIKDDDFRLDVVPARMPQGKNEPLSVPDRDWNKWIQSDPLGFAKTLSEVNQSNGQMVVPLIKMFKHWRCFQMTYRRPKSYYLEALVFQHVVKGWISTDGKSYAELFTDLIRSVHGRWQDTLASADDVPTIPDPMLQHNVAFNWDRAAFETFMARLGESVKWSERALNKSQEQLDEAVVLWQKVFGSDYFIDTADIRLRQKAVWISSGTAYVASSGRVTPSPSLSEKSIPSPKHKFYGEDR